MPKVIVLIADQDDPKHGEIAVLDSNVEAERLVEVLLEAGTPPGRVRVFSGAELEAQVTQKPRVELVECEWAETPAAQADPWQAPAEAAVALAPVLNGVQPEGQEIDETASAERGDEQTPEPLDESSDDVEEVGEELIEEIDEDAAPSESSEPAEPHEPAPSLALFRRLPQVELMPELKH